MRLKVNQENEASGLNRNVSMDELINHSRLDTLAHRDKVIACAEVLTENLVNAVKWHDQSKLESPEVEVFAEYGAKLKGLTYGSEEYKQCLSEMDVVLDHHYSSNRHHPEYFGNYQLKCSTCSPELTTFSKDYGTECPFCHKPLVKSYTTEGMNLIDIVEMVCDWKASSLRHDDGDVYKSLEINAKRFNLSDELVNLIKNTLPLLDSIRR